MRSAQIIEATGAGCEGIQTNRRKLTLIFATSYPFLNIFWTMIIFFAWVIFIWIAITILIDLFRRHDVGGWMKALWCVIIIIFPFIGVLLYLIIYHDGMNERRMKDSEAAQASFDQAVRQAAATGGPASEIETAQKLLDAGTITQAEFDAIKAKALAAH